MTGREFDAVRREVNDYADLIGCIAADQKISIADACCIFEVYLKVKGHEEEMLGLPSDPIRREYNR